MSKICKLSLFSSVFTKCLAGWLPSWWFCGLSHCDFGMFPFLISVCSVQQLPKCCIAEPLECWNCLGWRTCLLQPFHTHCLSWSSGLSILRELSYHLDAKSWPHYTWEELAESWQSRAVGIAACWIVAGLRSGWQQPASSAGAKLLPAPCLCHTPPQGASLLSFSRCRATVKAAFFPTSI